MVEAESILQNLHNANLDDEDWVWLARLFGVRGDDAAKARVTHFLHVAADRRLPLWPLFDQQSYASRISDESQRADVLKQDTGSALLHWLRHGKPEGIPTTGLFSEQWYVSKNSKQLASSTEQRPFLHYLSVGRRRNLACHPNLSSKAVRSLRDLSSGQRALTTLPQAKVTTPEGPTLVNGSLTGAGKTVHKELTHALCILNEKAPDATASDLRVLVRGLTSIYESMGNPVKLSELQILSLLFDADIYYALQRPSDVLVSRVRGIGEVLLGERSSCGIGPLFLFDTPRTHSAPSILEWIRGSWHQLPNAVERFPVERYALLNPDIEPAKAFRHFLTWGQFETRNYGNGFDFQYYHARHRLAPHSVSPYQDFLKHLYCGVSRLPSGFSLSVSLNRDLQFAPDRRRDHLWERATGYGEAIDSLLEDWLSADLKSVSAIEPSVISGAETVPIVADRLSTPYRELSARMRDAITSVDPDILLLVPHITLGGADRLATFVGRALLDAGHTPLVVITDRNVCQLSGDHNELAVLNLHGEEPHVSPERATLDLLRWSGVDKVLNINSGAGWQCYAKHGQKLSKALDLYAYLFCWEFEPMRAHGKYGYAAEYLRESLPHLKQVLVDNRKFADDLAEFVGLSGARFRMQAIHTPLSKEVRRSDRPGSREKSIFWVGRNHHQKRFDRVIELAERLPSWQFRCWVDLDRTRVLELPNNIVVNEPTPSLGDIPWRDCSAFLLTSDYEGLPLTLIELANAEIPIVASDVGGVSDLVDKQTGWLVDPAAPLDAWIRALKAATAADDDVECRTKALRRRVLSLCDTAVFRARILSVLFDE